MTRQTCSKISPALLAVRHWKHRNEYLFCLRHLIWNFCEATQQLNATQEHPSRLLCCLLWFRSCHFDVTTTMQPMLVAFNICLFSPRNPIDTHRFRWPHWQFSSKLCRVHPCFDIRPSCDHTKFAPFRWFAQIECWNPDHRAFFSWKTGSVRSPSGRDAAN